MKRITIIVSVLLFLSLLLPSPGTANTLELLCRVDIGDPASEAGHNVMGWGGVEPGGRWAGDSEFWDVANARVVWEPGGNAERARCATLTLDRHIAPGAAPEIRFRHLDGLNYRGYVADDSFDVYLREAGAPDWIFVYHYEATQSQQWVVTTVDIPAAIDENANIDVKLCATAPDTWRYFTSHWGQVAFDWIELWGETSGNGGGEGFTPGYWKNHLDDWGDTAYSPGDSFNVIFTAGPDITLYQAVKKKGNRVNSLIRHAAAALLNASHPDVDYDLTVEEVIALVNDAFDSGNYRDAKDILEGFNEQGGDMNG